MKLRKLIAGALLLGASFLGLAQPAQANQTNRYYFQCTDVLKYPVPAGQPNSNLYGIFGTGVLLPTGTSLSRNVMMDISAYADSGSSATGYIYYTNPTGDLIPLNVSFTVGSCEQRRYLSFTAPSIASSVAIYVQGPNHPLRVRDFRAFFSPNSIPYTYASPLAFQFSAPLAGQSLTGWPAITNGTSTGVGLSGTIGYSDGRANSTDHMWVSIQRYSDDYWWNGTSWVPCYAKMLATKNATAWSYNSVPTGANLSNGDYLVIVSAHDQSDSTGNPHFCTERRIDITIDNSQEVSGRCVSIFADSTFNATDRNGPPGAQVKLTTPGGATVATVTPNSGGYYTFSNVAPGTYNVSATAVRDGANIDMDPSPRSITVSNAPVAVDRFALYSIFGYVRVPGSGSNVPLANATVKLYNPNGVLIGTRTTGADGKYEFRLLRPVNHTVKVTASGYTFPDGVGTLPTVGETFSPCDKVNFVGSPGTF